MSENNKYACPDCSREYGFDGEEVWCWCNKQKTVVVKPCMGCNKPITHLDLCEDCAEDNDPFKTYDPLHGQPVRYE